MFNAATTCGLLSAAAILAIHAPARAFSDPLAFEDPVELGGGGGRWFTGSPIEGYGCDVCHEGGAPFSLQVTGLPEVGYVPGADYELQIRWPSELTKVAAALELANDALTTAGSLGLPDEASYSDEDLCEGANAFATEVRETTDGRSLATMAECGARVMRVRWTAPASGSGDVWFSAALVHVDDDDSPAGDGVAYARTVIGPAGDAASATTIGSAAGCRGAAGQSPSGLSALFLSVAWLSFRALRRTADRRRA